MNKNLKAGLITVGVFISMLILCLCIAMLAVHYPKQTIAVTAILATIVTVTFLFLIIKSTLK